MMTIHGRLVALTMTILTAGGCDDPSDEERGDLGASTRSIIDGEDIVDSTYVDRGVVQVNVMDGSWHVETCTGTLLTNRHVLTARHCTFKSHTHMMVGWKTSAGTVARRATGPQSEIRSATTSADWVLLVLDSPLPNQGSEDGFGQEIHPGSASEVIGQTVECFGYGNNVFWGNGDGVGAGTLRRALLVPDSITSNGIKYRPNAEGQIQYTGDSGGPCFFEGFPFGVLSSHYADHQVQYTWAVPQDSYRDEVNQLIHAMVTTYVIDSTGRNGPFLIQYQSPTGYDFAISEVATPTVRTNVARRANWLEVRVVEPLNAFCSVPGRATVPMSGNVDVSIACLSDGLIPVLFGG